VNRRVEQVLDRATPGYTLETNRFMRAIRPKRGLSTLGAFGNRFREEITAVTPQQIALVKTSWQKLAARPDQVAELFYSRLFELEPRMRALFNTDMRTQGRKLVNMLKLAVSDLERLDKLLPAVHELGRKHALYGVEERHYDTVGAALIDTLARGLKDAFTSEVREAWLTTYTALAGAMKSGAARYRPAFMRKPQMSRSITDWQLA
jgi:nitric oxide dioxygenase